LPLYSTPFRPLRSGPNAASRPSRQKQIPSSSPEFKANFDCVQTAGVFRPAEESPSRQGYHWNGNAETYYLIGEAMGEAMKKHYAK